MEDAALFASAFASVSVERVGAAQSIPTRQEAITRMQKYASLVVTS